MLQQWSTPPPGRPLGPCGSACLSLSRQLQQLWVVSGRGVRDDGPEQSPGRL